MALRALVWRVWSLAGMFLHDDSNCFFGNLVFKNQIPTLRHHFSETKINHVIDRVKLRFAQHSVVYLIGYILGMKGKFQELMEICKD